MFSWVFINMGIHQLQAKKWAVYFKELSPPAESNIILSKVSSGILFEGHPETLDFPVFFVIVSDQEKNSINEYYRNNLPPENLEYQGLFTKHSYKKTYLSVDEFPQNDYMGISSPWNKNEIQKIFDGDYDGKQIYCITLSEEGYDFNNQNHP